MDWLIDLGNTRLKWAALGDDGVASAMTALAHGDDDFALRWQATLAHASAGDRVWLAAVAPPSLRDAVEASLQARGLHVETVQVRSDCGGLRLGYADPA
ncbi:MAG TPA: type III pantothenate kinase, partial [Arenimonas sp.]|nr:type III pantothenate kinase [Arenimonas sp.]